MRGCPSSAVGDMQLCGDKPRSKAPVLGGGSPPPTARGTASTPPCFPSSVIAVWTKMLSQKQAEVEAALYGTNYNYFGSIRI
jgi:hypothetical protein